MVENDEEIEVLFMSKGRCQPKNTHLHEHELCDHYPQGTVLEEGQYLNIPLPSERKDSQNESSIQRKRIKKLENENTDLKEKIIRLEITIQVQDKLHSD